MLTVAFWNVFKKPDVLPHLACLLRQHQVDIFLLAECPKDIAVAITALNKLGTGNWREETNHGSKIRALTRLGSGDCVHLFTGIAGDLAVWTVRTKQVASKEILLAAVHLPSKAGGLSEADQTVVAQEIIQELNEVEDNRNHRNTALVGDFNMPPYDPGMTSVTGIHGLMTKHLASLPDRKYRNRLHRRFYNMMWGLMGDRTPGPAGTFRWESSVPHNPHWIVLDQMLLRKGLIAHFRVLEILGHDGTHNLLRPDGFPNRDDFSDHLPLVFTLDI